MRSGGLVWSRWPGSEINRLARLLRVWEKKRGKRRTGSKFVGTVGELLFAATLLVSGAISLIALLASRAAAMSQPYQPGFGFWVMVLVLSSFTLLGGGGVLWTLLHASASAERRSALAKRAAAIDLSGDASSGRRRLPSIPSDANFTNSPGVRQRYRLPVVQSPAWRLVFATLFCLIWNVSAVLSIAVAANSFLSNRPDWFLTIFSVPFVFVGAWAIYDFVRQWLLHAGIGPTTVEISHHPLQPGGSYTVSLSQAGRLPLKTLAVHLVCEEAATYRQGTDVRTERRRVFDRQICRQSDFEITPGMPFQYDFTLNVPPEAMHTFQSEHNAINWMLVVYGEAEAWPPFERAFPLIVYPLHDGDQDADRTAHRAEVA